VCHWLSSTLSDDTVGLGQATQPPCENCSVVVSQRLFSGVVHPGTAGKTVTLDRLGIRAGWHHRTICWGTGKQDLGLHLRHCWAMAGRGSPSILAQEIYICCWSAGHNKYQFGLKLKPECWGPCVQVRRPWPLGAKLQPEVDCGNTTLTYLGGVKALSKSGNRSTK